MAACALQGQGAVYAEVAGLVARVLQGSNACILAYGTSGSGKTFTLAGTPSQPGINFRAIKDLFRCRRSGTLVRHAPCLLAGSIALGNRKHSHIQYLEHLPCSFHKCSAWILTRGHAAHA